MKKTIMLLVVLFTFFSTGFLNAIPASASELEVTADQVKKLYENTAVIAMEDDEWNYYDVYTYYGDPNQYVVLMQNGDRWEKPNEMEYIILTKESLEIKKGKELSKNKTDALLLAARNAQDYADFGINNDAHSTILFRKNLIDNGEWVYIQANQEEITPNIRVYLPLDQLKENLQKLLSDGYAVLQIKNSSASWVDDIQLENDKAILVTPSDYQNNNAVYIREDGTILKRIAKDVQSALQGNSSCKLIIDETGNVKRYESENGETETSESRFSDTSEPSLQNNSDSYSSVVSDSQETVASSFENSETPKSASIIPWIIIIVCCCGTSIFVILLALMKKNAH